MYASWAVVLSACAVFIVMTMMFAAGFGNENPLEFMVLYGIGQGQVFGIVETLEVLIITLFPWILDNDITTEARDTAKNLGLY